MLVKKAFNLPVNVPLSTQCKRINSHFVPLEHTVELKSVDILIITFLLIRILFLLQPVLQFFRDKHQEYLLNQTLPVVILQHNWNNFGHSVDKRKSIM
jgi:hypothetical protein